MLDTIRRTELRGEHLVACPTLFNVSTMIFFKPTLCRGGFPATCVVIGGVALMYFAHNQTYKRNVLPYDSEKTDPMGGSMSRNQEAQLEPNRMAKKYNCSEYPPSIEPRD